MTSIREGGELGEGASLTPDAPSSFHEEVLMLTRDEELRQLLLGINEDFHDYQPNLEQSPRFATVNSNLAGGDMDEVLELRQVIRDLQFRLAEVEGELERERELSICASCHNSKTPMSIADVQQMIAIELKSQSPILDLLSCIPSPSSAPSLSPAAHTQPFSTPTQGHTASTDSEAECSTYSPPFPSFSEEMPVQDQGYEYASCRRDDQSTPEESIASSQVHACSAATKACTDVAVRAQTLCAEPYHATASVQAEEVLPLSSSDSYPALGTARESGTKSNASDRILEPHPALSYSEVPDVSEAFSQSEYSLSQSEYASVPSSEGLYHRPEDPVAALISLPASSHPHTAPVGSHTSITEAYSSSPEVSTQLAKEYGAWYHSNQAAWESVEGGKEGRPEAEAVSIEPYLGYEGLHAVQYDGQYTVELNERAQPGNQELDHPNVAEMAPPLPPPPHQSSERRHRTPMTGSQQDEREHITRSSFSRRPRDQHLPDPSAASHKRSPGRGSQIEEYRPAVTVTASDGDDRGRSMALALEIPGPPPSRPIRSSILEAQRAQSIYMLDFRPPVQSPQHPIESPSVQVDSPTKYFETLRELPYVRTPVREAAKAAPSFFLAGTGKSLLDSLAYETRRDLLAKYLELQQEAGQS